jgi:hypothetical protein
MLYEWVDSLISVKKMRLLERLCLVVNHGTLNSCRRIVAEKEQKN